MARNNRNEHVLSLLGWHAHDTGGVAVPFTHRNPLRDRVPGGVVETGLVRRLRNLAADLATGSDVPRILFLVGGPGNGKSECVQDFLAHYDAAAGFQGLLVDELTRRFAPNPLSPWCVRVDAGDVAPENASWSTIPAVVVIQDASASEGSESASDVLRHAIRDNVLGGAEKTRPLFVCCLNRGILADASRDAVREGASDEAALLNALIDACAGTTTVGEAPRACWPLDHGIEHLAGLIGCWPLDAESLLEEPGDGPSPADQVISAAVEDDDWELGECGTCPAAAECPFLQNATWLRAGHRRTHLLVALRRSELALGHRLTFRDLLSLAAELTVGDRADYSSHEHPCDWVGENVEVARAGHGEKSVEAQTLLVEHLYPHAMFPSVPSAELASALLKKSKTAQAPITLTLAKLAAPERRTPTSHVRRLVASGTGRILDPANETPTDPGNPLADLEVRFSMSAKVGQVAWEELAEPPSLIELRWLTSLVRAGEEWDRMAREKGQANLARSFLLVTGAVVAKRSAAIRLGHHANEKELSDYRAAIYEMSRLKQVVRPLMSMISHVTPLSLVATLGQPTAHARGFATVQGRGLEPRAVLPARRVAGSTEPIPGHDVPTIVFKNSRVPMSFDLYRALDGITKGCEVNSLPASTRASLDRVSHLHVGQLCRSVQDLQMGLVDIEVGGARLEYDDRTESFSLDARRRT